MAEYTCSSENLSIAPRLSVAKLRLYPNPGAGIYTLVLPPNAPGAEVHILNSLGQKVLTQEVFQDGVLDISSQPAGTYFVRVLIDGQSLSATIVRE